MAETKTAGGEAGGDEAGGAGWEVLGFFFFTGTKVHILTQLPQEVGWEVGTFKKAKLPF